jgi:2-hydroxy-3-keto-5-methylthiopentenyl-1-phosphate phosphatase
MSTERRVMAICYDFDKTLAPGNMQEQGLLQDLGYDDVTEFWDKVAELAESRGVEGNLAYMYLLAEEGITREQLCAYGTHVQLYPGLDTWFERINSYGLSKGVSVEHYVISSGLREMILGSSIGSSFTGVFASCYLFSSSGKVLWPAQVINYTNKTQFLFRISKGVLDINDTAVNDKFTDFRVPFTNMVYIGDSETDIPCMALVNGHGGYSIGVYSGDRSRVEKMSEDGRISRFALADYSSGSEMETLIKGIIDKI